MKAPRTRLASTIAARSLKQTDQHTLAQEVAAYLLAEGRVGELDSIMRDVQADWAAAGFVEVLAASAHELTSEVKVEITERIKALYPAAERIAITEIHDPTVLGGVRLSLANQQLDMTVEAKLNKFKQLTLG